MNTTEQELLEQCMYEIKDNSCNIGGQYSQKTMRLLAKIEAYLAKPVQEQSCNPHPNAPHGFSRNASHNANRYVCECDGWSEKENIQQEPMSDDEILNAIARGWCHAKNEHKNMDIDLVSAIASEVYHAIKAHHGIK